MSSDKKPEKSLEENVTDWLSTEGYGLEFLAANIFSEQGFSVHQGNYVRDKESQIPREIDVVAEVTASMESLLSDKQSHLRIEYIVECKWSAEKPWVVFSSPNNRMAPSACITQSIASHTGHALLWTLVGDTELQKLDTFSVPERPGYGGRQAFSKSNDVFYSAMQSITSAASSLAKSYDPRNGFDLRPILEWATVVLPIIVIDGKIFDVYFDERTGKTAINQVNHVRLHWKGAEARSHIVTVDLVTLEELSNFVKQRRKEADVILERMQTCLTHIQNCYTQKSLVPLEITKGPRGMIGLPYVLERIRQIEEEAKLRSNQD